MREGGRKVWKQALGPRALAVISCALALLAAQPAGGGSAKGQGVAAVRLAGGTIETAKSEIRSPKDERQKTKDESRGGPRRELERGLILARGGSSYRVLATVEVLQRLLAFELRPLERQVVPALVLAPVCVGEEPRDMIRGLGVVGVDRGSIPAMGVERAFAIARRLLAPPTA